MRGSTRQPVRANNNPPFPPLSCVIERSPAFMALFFLPACADTLHANLLEVKDLFEVKRFALFDQVCGLRMWLQLDGSAAAGLPCRILLHGARPC